MNISILDNMTSRTYGTYLEDIIRELVESLKTQVKI